MSRRNPTPLPPTPRVAIIPTIMTEPWITLRRVHRTGNSLAITIPPGWARALRLGINSYVEITITPDMALHVVPFRSPPTQNPPPPPTQQNPNENSPHA